MSDNYWNPWHGCHRCSTGCANCYVYYLDSTRGLDAGKVTKSKTGFDAPVKKDRSGCYKIKAGTEVSTCFTSDFFIEEADEWRPQAWEYIKTRSDLSFIIPTKRIARFAECVPEDWGSGYENVTVALTCENQEMTERRMPVFLSVPVKRRFIFASPLLEEIHLEEYLRGGGIDLVSAGGESYVNARECRFEWMESLYLQCRDCRTRFDIHQTGSNFVFGGKRYRIRHSMEFGQAQKAMEYLKRKYSGNE